MLILLVFENAYPRIKQENKYHIEIIADFITDPAIKRSI